MLTFVRRWPELPWVVARLVRERSFAPVSIVDMLITEDCNCRCDYCFIQGKRPKRMTEEIVKATVDFLLIKSQNLNEVELIFLGGEPLLAFDLMQLAVDYGEFRSRCLGKRLTFAMTTNGTLFDEEKLRFCRDHGIKFLLSIDGDRETHNLHRKFADGRGSYDTVVRLIGLMKLYQRWLGARVTPTPENMHQLLKNIKHLYGLGINQFIVGPATGIAYSDEDINVFRQQMKLLGDYYIEQVKAKAPFRLSLFEQALDDAPGSKRGFWGCGAGRARLSVSASGEIQPCAKVQGLNDLAGIPLYSLGNVLTGFSGLEARREFIAFRYDRRTACHNCDLKDDCAGGCPAVNYQASGCIWLPDPCECKLTRVILETKREIQRRLSELSAAA
ncbi:MAG: hypothetical protein DRO73_08510 [Candidatus Thorarchaeota archaeon]|nr:MAG: hypothetical protein DRO73_08510 [Candidatus Thorarchaeota archaeon]